MGAFEDMTKRNQFENMIKGSQPGADLRTAGELPAPPKYTPMESGPDEEYQRILQKIDTQGEGWLSELEQIGQRYKGTQGGWLVPEDEVRISNLSRMLNQLYGMKSSLISSEAQRRERRAEKAGEYENIQTTIPGLQELTNNAAKRNLGSPFKTGGRTKKGVAAQDALNALALSGVPGRPTIPETPGR